MHDKSVHSPCITPFIFIFYLLFLTNKLNLAFSKTYLNITKQTVD